MARLAWQPRAVHDDAARVRRQHVELKDRAAFDAILTMIDRPPGRVLAYWGGYHRPTRYWHGPNGFRGTSPGFASGSIVLNRTDDIADTGPVSTGGEPIRD